MNVKAILGKLSPELRLSLMLAAAGAALGLLVVAEWFSVGRTLRLPQVSAETPKVQVEQPLASPFKFPAVSEFHDLVERPLFVEGRRPLPDIPPEPPPAVVHTPLDLKLMGLIFSPSGKLALLADPKGKYKRVKQGAVVGGWTLKELKADGVVMQQEGETKELALLKVKPKLPGQGVAPPPAEAKSAKKPPGNRQPPRAGVEPPDEEDVEPDENTDTESDGAEEAEDPSEE